MTRVCSPSSLLTLESGSSQLGRITYSMPGERLMAPAYSRLDKEALNNSLKDLLSQGQLHVKSRNMH